MTAELSDWLDRLLSAIDGKDAAAFAGFFAEQASFQLGDFPRVEGAAAIAAGTAAFFEQIAALEHRLEDHWAVPGALLCRGQVRYTRLDGSHCELPFANVMEGAPGPVTMYRVYIDLAPLWQG